jgi:RimJ/RimL family protein N-acetyltransferase
MHLESWVVSDAVETGRLRLRPPKESDLDALHRLQVDPRMMRDLADGHVYSIEESEGWLRHHIDLRAERGFGLWCAELRSNGDVIGWIDLTLPDWFPALLPDPEIGWFVDRRHWGRGLATEGASAALRVASGELGFERVIAICKIENVASARVMEKIGMTFVEELLHPRLGFPLSVYDIKLEEAF